MDAMSIDLEKLAPAPFYVLGPTEHAGLCYVRPGKDGPHAGSFGNNSHSLEHAQLFALARNWLDVQVRRGWTVYRIFDGMMEGSWRLSYPLPSPTAVYYPNPVAAMKAGVAYDRVLTDRETTAKKE